MRAIYKITIGGVLLAGAAAFAAARVLAAGTKTEPIIADIGTDRIESFSASVIRDATISDEGESYSGEPWLKSDGAVSHPKWFEGDKLVKADDAYYLIKAEQPPGYYYKPGGDFGNYIDIGDPDSEKAGAVEFVNAMEPETRSVGAGEYTFRRLERNGAMVVNLACSPDEINYLTVRLWGGDTGDTILWLVDPISGNMSEDNDQQPHRNANVVDRRSWVELSYVCATPQYDGGFIYATYEIPTVYTKGRQSVSLRIYSTGGPANYANISVKEQTEPSRGIYDVYMTQSAEFDPAEFGASDGGYTDNPQSIFDISDSRAMAEQKSALNEAVSAGLSALRKWQIYGDETPEYMRGMITRADWSSNPPQTEEDWKNRYYNDGCMLKQNMTPLNMLELAAYAYNNAAELGLGEGEKDELLDRVIAGIDFLCRAQGSNGGFFSTGWIGGPERGEASGNNLTGFGLKSAGKAALYIYGSLSEEVKSELIDSDADGEPDTRRLDAWNAMFKSARDYLITIEGGYGHAPNQDMANSIAALRFDAFLGGSGGEQLSKSRAGAVLDRCFGFSDNLVTSCAWVSPKFTILENFGAVQGGYSGDYGSNAIVLLSELAELAYESRGFTYRNYLKDLYETIDKYYFTGKKSVNGELFAQEYTEGIISNRNCYYPGTERYPIDLYAALEMKNDTALKIIANYLEQKNISSLLAGGGDLSESNSHFEDNVLDAARLFLNFDAITDAARDRNIEEYDFLMEDDSVPRYAWADEIARNVVIKDGGRRIYMALNWRNPVHSNTIYNTPYNSGGQLIKANNLCRVHDTNEYYDRYGYAAVTTVGYDDWTETDRGAMRTLMTMRYGDYIIIMNSSGEAYTGTELEELAGLDAAKTYLELISGEVYRSGNGYWHSDGSIMRCETNSTLVLKEVGLYVSEPVISGGRAYSMITNNTDEAEKITLFAVSRGEDGTIESVCAKTADAQPGMTEISLPAADAAETYIWDGRQTPAEIRRKQ